MAASLMQPDRILATCCQASLALVGIALSLSIFYGLVTDDYLFIRIYALQEYGDSLYTQLIRTFAFFPSPSENLHAITKGYSHTNWFTDLNVEQRFFRPIPALTHYLDYIAGSKPWLMHLHNLFYAGLVLLLLWNLLKLMQLEHDGRWLIMALFVVDSATLWSGWIAQRNVLMTLAAALGSLICFLRYQTSGKHGDYLATLILLALGLTCSEGGIVVSVFLFFTPLLYGQQLFSTKHILHMLPVAILCMLFIFFYQKFGFGVSNHPFYINPIVETSKAFASLVIKLPAFVFSGLGLLPAETAYLFERTVDPMTMAAAYGVLNLVVFCLIIASWLYVKSPFRSLYNYGMACSAGALLPLMASMTADRSGNYFKLGIAIAFGACILQMTRSDTLKNKGRLFLKALPWLLLTKAVFVLSAAIGWAIYLTRPDPIIQSLKTMESTPKNIVYLKVHNFYFTSFMLEKIRFHHDESVESAQRLIADNGPAILERIDADSITITAKNNGLLLDLFDLPMEPANFAVGNTYSAGFMNITVLKAQQGLPQSLQVDFSIPTESITFINYNGQRYEPLTLPKEGQLILL